MGKEIYFDSTGASPLDFASLNCNFYEQFVNEHGSFKSNATLWPGEQLHSLILSLINYRNANTTLLTLSKVDAYITYYRTLYKRLTTIDW